MVLNSTVGPTHFELKLVDIVVEGMRFILNSLNYIYVSPMVEF